MSELNAYALLVLVGFLPSEMWRVLGFVAARRITDESEFFIWARSVAIAVLAGVIAKILLWTIDSHIISRVCQPDHSLTRTFACRLTSS